MTLSTADDWKNATLEDIDRAVNGAISSGAFTRTVAKRSILDRLLFALDRAYAINQANPQIRLIIYNLHREMDGKPPLDNLDGHSVQIFSIMVSKDQVGDVGNELYIIEAGEIVRVGGFGVKDDLFSSRLAEFIMEMGEE